MIIIDFFGFSGSGKSFLAKKISSSHREIDNQFLNISKNSKILRLLKKIYFISFIRITDISIILKIQNEFLFNTKKIKFKNLISFMYLIGYIKSKSNKKKILVLDHGFFQCILSCFLYSKQKNYNLIVITKLLSKIFIRLDNYYGYYNLIEMNHDWNLIKRRLLIRDGSKSKKIFNDHKIDFLNLCLDNCKIIYNNIKNKKIETFSADSFINSNHYEIKMILKLNEKSS